jgi:hypothetical protein
VDLPTFVQIAYGNIGAASTSQEFSIMLYLDDEPVARWTVTELLADQQVQTREWEGLGVAGRIAPGVHVITVVIDPGGAVTESQTDDNTYRYKFTWGSGMRPSIGDDVPARAIPSGRSRAEIFAPPMWDGALVATQEAGSFRAPQVFSSNRQTFVHWAVWNPDQERPTGPYSVLLWLDGDVVAQWERPGLAPGAIDTVMDWPLVWAGSFRFAGPHRLAIGVAPIDIPETELTNVYRDFLWSTDIPTVVSPPPAPPSAQESQELAGTFGRFMAANGLQGAADPAMAGRLREGVGALYSLLYNRSLEQENLEIYLLSAAEFKKWVALLCSDLGSGPTGDLQTRYGASCQNLVNAQGFATFWRGKYRIAVRSDFPAMTVLLNLAHELGHFRQNLLRPDMDVPGATLNAYALKEAQAFVHEALIVRALEEATGQRLTQYPALTGYADYLEQRVEEMVRSKDVSEHARGRLLVWLAVLSDQNLRFQRTGLAQRGYLSVPELQGLMRYLLTFGPGDLDRYISTRMAELDRLRPAIQSLAQARLVQNLSAQAEGLPQLRDAGLLTP